MHKQITSQLMMVRPANFSSNIETLETNKFQSDLDKNDCQELIQSHAIEEFNNMVKILRNHHITVIDIDDLKKLKKGKKKEKEKKKRSFNKKKSFLKAKNEKKKRETTSS